MSSCEADGGVLVAAIVASLAVEAIDSIAVATPSSVIIAFLLQSLDLRTKAEFLVGSQGVDGASAAADG